MIFDGDGDPEYVNPDERDAYLHDAGYGDNSDFRPGDVDALEHSAAEAVKPREWVSIDALDDLRSALRSGDRAAKDRAQKNLTAAVNNDLCRFVSGDRKGAHAGDDLQKLRWRRDGLAYAGLLATIEYVRRDQTRSVDVALVGLIAWFADRNDGVCAETRETFAAILNRSPDAIGDALARIDKAKTYDCFRGEKNSRRFRVAVVPAMARANALNLPVVFQREARELKVPSPALRRAQEAFGRRRATVSSQQEEAPVTTRSSQLPNSVATRSSQLDPKSVTTRSSQLKSPVTTGSSQQAASVATRSSHSYPITQREYPSEEVVTQREVVTLPSSTTTKSTGEVEDREGGRDLVSPALLGDLEFSIAPKDLDRLARKFGVSDGDPIRDRKMAFLAAEAEKCCAQYFAMPINPKTGRRQRERDGRLSDLRYADPSNWFVYGWGDGIRGRLAKMTAEAASASGLIRRHVRDLDKVVPNAASVPLSRGTVNTILDAADKLRRGEPIACIVDLDAVLMGLKRSDDTSPESLARRVALRAARRATGLSLEDNGWLKDAATIVDAIQADWPHAPREVIERVVGDVNTRPQLAGICPFDWSERSQAEAVATIGRTFGGYLKFVAQKGLFTAEQQWIDGETPFLEGEIPSWLSALRKRHPRIANVDWVPFYRRLADRLASWRDQFGKVDLVSAMNADLQADAHECFGLSAEECSLFSTSMRVQIRTPIQLVKIDEDGRALSPLGAVVDRRAA